jgi:hypothetical protein
MPAARRSFGREALRLRSDNIQGSCVNDSVARLKLPGVYKEF